MSIQGQISKMGRKILSVPDFFIDKISPRKPHAMFTQGESFKNFLPYVTADEDFDGRQIYILSDGSLGIMWSLSLIPHETLHQNVLTEKLESFSNLFNFQSDDVALQVIFDSNLESKSEFANTFCSDSSIAEYILNKRIHTLLSENNLNKPLKRKVFLTLRLANKGLMSLEKISSGDHSETEAEIRNFNEIKRTLTQYSQEIEYNLKHADIKFKTVEVDEFIYNLRETFHSLDSIKSNDCLKTKYDEDKTISSQILKGFIEATPNAIGVEKDTWEVLSWIDQPPSVYHGMMSKILMLDLPFKMVLNIRRCADISDLEKKKFMLKNATDSMGELQKNEIKSTQDRVARGENLLFLSIHMIVRNRNLETIKTKEIGVGKSIVSRMKTLTNTDFILEKYAAPAIFLMSLPFGYSKVCSGFSGREKRVLSRNMAPYLPILGGFQGTKTPMQLMVARAGNLIWLNPFDSETNAHLAVIASAGGGKSFFAQNMMMSFVARYFNKKPLVFIIDKKTSYEIFARVVGESIGSQIIKPPKSFPNIFRGKMDEFRLPVVVGILKTAITLVTKDAELGAIEDMILTQAVKETFEQNSLDATTDFHEGNLVEKQSGKIKIPTLSDVVKNLFPVCAQFQLSKSIAEKLWQYFSPFLENGPYNNLFNSIENDDLDPQTPGVSLYDIDHVSTHPVLSTITTQIILSEILRQIRRPENIGRPGMLVIEEVGVLAEGSSELTAFIQDAWKTFRKLGFSCVGLTNEVDDYLKKPGAREIWNVSPHKIILKMTNEDLGKALAGDEKTAPLIGNKLFGNIIGSLKKEDGKYSQGFWLADDASGSFTYTPTGYDYWCASSKPIEVHTVNELAQIYSGAGFDKPYFESIKWLEKNFPLGIRNKDSSLRKLSENELAVIRESL